ncbi:U-scoloptoxin(05)-Sm1a isoform X1 [Condylostylus longicornis]|uniref:U-scoloptoxin(05)-Sm1a isoform X1 n=1 Tax=Condylostylus longicornis TaxID=2530218 RepID=UPI00244E15A8|nr:U-scoloptoxin(05)-Sm1a isoform X1 [Condylostylus longicornis]
MKTILLLPLFLCILTKSAYSIRCYICNTTDSTTPFQCGEWFERFDHPDIQPQDCSAVHGAQYCIKHIGRFEGGIGAKRYCSSKDLGNYCDYVKQRGDTMEYRSCIFTCSTDGCNNTISIQPQLKTIGFLTILTICMKFIIK